jgi:hypothetical protein
MNHGTTRPGSRHKEHGADALRLLACLLSIPQNTPRDGWPSTAELQEARIYGLRPVNPLVDLRHGKYNDHRYDIEMISCGHGVNRWRLHWPNRPGYPKNKPQTVLHFAGSPDWYEQAGKPRPSARPIGQDDGFVLSPPELRR